MSSMYYHTMPAIVGSLLMGFIVTSCTPPSTQETEQNPTIAVTRSTTMPPRATSVASSTPLPLTDTPTPISLPLSAFTRRCLNLETSTTKGSLAEGTIFLEQDGSDMILLLTSMDEEPVLLGGVPAGFPEGVSQDWAWMTYHTDQSGIGTIASTGDLATTPHRNDRWGRLQGWLDSERVIFEGQTLNSDVLYIYNPFTEQEEVFAPSITDRYEYDREWSGWHVWKFVPDPTLTRLAYVRALGRAEKQYRPELVLINLENGETLWELERFSPGEGHLPVWSPDGRQLAVISDDYQSVEGTYRWEVFTVDRAGQSTQWIDISVKPEGLFWLLGEQTAWSPNGRYVAFYGDSLYILDTASRQAIDFCIPYATQVESLIYPENTIIWSPDSRQVIFQPGNSPAIVIDIGDNRAIQLVDDVALRPVGWISSP